MFEVGQCVWDVLHGEGTVASIGKNYTYPVIVKFTNNEEAISFPQRKIWLTYENEIY